MDADPRYVLLPYITYKRKQLDKIIKVVNPKICSVSKMCGKKNAGIKTRHQIKNAGIKTRQPKTVSSK